MMDHQLMIDQHSIRFIYGFVLYTQSNFLFFEVKHLNNKVIIFTACLIKFNGMRPILKN